MIWQPSPTGPGRRATRNSFCWRLAAAPASARTQIAAAPARAIAVTDELKACLAVLPLLVQRMDGQWTSSRLPPELLHGILKAALGAGVEAEGKAGGPDVVV